MSKPCAELKEEYICHCHKQYQGEIIPDAVEIEMRLYHGTKRKCDIDNFSKLVFDALTGIIYEDDSQIVKLGITKGYDKENPRVELDIWPLKES